MVKRDVLPAMCKEYDFYAKANGEGAPAYLTKRSKKLAVIQDSLKEVSKSGTAPWITLDEDAVKGTFVQYPRREEVTDLADVKEQLVVELYSK